MSKICFYIKKVLFYSFIIIYIILIAKLLLFKHVTLLGLFNVERIPVRSLNLTPFRTLRMYLSNNSNLWVSIMNVVGNIILFVPLGIYLQIFKKDKKVWHCVALTFVASLCFEFTQYILGIGVTDIDDVILNTIGGLLGAAMYSDIHLLLKDDTRTKAAFTFLFCLVAVCFVIAYLVLVGLGFAIKIF